MSCLIHAPPTPSESEYMTTVYFEEITSDDEGPEREHDGEKVEQLAPFEFPVHTLTSDMVEAHKAQLQSQATAAPPEPAPAPESAPTPPPSSAEVEALRAEGNAAFGAKRFEDAVRLYGDAIKLAADNGLLYGNRAAALIQLGKAELAVADAREMVRLLPSTAKAHFRLGSALAVSGQSADAARALMSALKLDLTNDAIVEALRKEMSRPALKKGKQHAPLLRQCSQVLADAKAAKAAGVPPPPPPPPPPKGRARWSEMPTTQGVRPPKRGGSTLTAAADRLWLIGGADRAPTVYGDVWEYPLDCGDGGGGSRAGWRVNELAGEVAVRTGHAAVALPVGLAAGCTASIVVFGGQDPRSSRLLNELRLLHVPSKIGVDATWSPPLTPLGPTPEPRNSHSLVADLDGDAGVPCLLLFGGALCHFLAHQAWPNLISPRLISPHLASSHLTSPSLAQTVAPLLTSSRLLNARGQC